MDLTNKTELELYFSNHFDTVLFSVLAEMYQTMGDYTRAKKVCEIGLKNHPDQAEGQFILAKSELGLGNLPQSEKWLKRVLKKVPGHIRATTALPMVQEQLGRPAQTLEESWKRLLAIDPENDLAQKYFDNTNLPVEKPATAADPAPQEQTQETTQEQTQNVIPPKTGKAPRKTTLKDVTLEGIELNPRLATFTFVAVLRNQGLFHQAMDVLDLLEKKGADTNRIEVERKKIQSEIEF